METPVEIVQLTQQNIPLYQPSLIRIYHEAFGQPPYNDTHADAAAFAENFSFHIHRPGFRCLAARRIHGGDVLGFAYGYNSRPGQWWYDLVARSMPPEPAQHWLANAFELVELAVLPQSQGNRIGSRLHDRILVGLTHSTALLSTMQVESGRALELYRSRGWVTLLQDFIFPGVDAPYLIMGLDLHPPQSSDPA